MDQSETRPDLCMETYLTTIKGWQQVDWTRLDLDQVSCNTIKSEIITTTLVSEEVKPLLALVDMVGHTLQNLLWEGQVLVSSNRQTIRTKTTQKTTIFGTSLQEMVEVVPLSTNRTMEIKIEIIDSKKSETDLISPQSENLSPKAFINASGAERNEPTLGGA